MTQMNMKPSRNRIVVMIMSMTMIRLPHSSQSSLKEIGIKEKKLISDRTIKTPNIIAIKIVVGFVSSYQKPKIIMKTTKTEFQSNAVKCIHPFRFASI